MTLVAASFAEVAPFLLPPLVVVGLLIALALVLLRRAGRAVLTVPIAGGQAFALRHTVAVPGEYSVWIRYEVQCAHALPRPQHELFLDLLVTCPNGQLRNERIRLGRRVSDSPAAESEGVSREVSTTAVDGRAHHAESEQARIVGNLPVGATLEVAGTLEEGAGTRLIAAAASLRRAPARA